MITFRLRLPCRTILRVFSRNPLVRGADRLEAVVMLLAVTVSLLTIPFAAAAGTAVHDSRSHVYAHQAQTRHPATATVIDHEGVIDSNTTATSAPPRTKITVPARWVVNGIERSGEVNAKPGTKSGDRVGIWVDSAGQLVDEPAPPARAIADAALAALGLWLSVAAVAGALLALTRAILIRVRNASWQHDIDSLFCTQR